MALDSSVYGSVGTCRLFIDYVQLCRAQGVPISHYHHGTGLTGTYEDVWNMNPAKTTISNSVYSDAEGWGDPTYYTRWGIQIDTDKTRPEIQKLLSTCNYYGILGHNFADITNNDTEIYILDDAVDGSNFSLNGEDYVENVYAPDVSGDAIKNGYKLKTISPNLESHQGHEQNCGFIVFLRTAAEENYIRCGAITIGRYFDFPHSANLSMNIDHSYDGIKKKRTIGGSDLVNVSYNSPPNWIGEYRPFTTNKESATLGYGARRSWDLTFSFLDKDAIFPKNFNEGLLFSQYETPSDTDAGMNLFGTFKQENILSHYFTLTQGGSIPHILQPDKTKEDFCLVRLDRSSLRINQTAPLLYDVKMRFVETW